MLAAPSPSIPISAESSTAGNSAALAGSSRSSLTNSQEDPEDVGLKLPMAGLKLGRRGGTLIKHSSCRRASAAAPSAGGPFKLPFDGDDDAEEPSFPSVQHSAWAPASCMPSFASCVPFEDFVKTSSWTPCLRSSSCWNKKIWSGARSLKTFEYVRAASPFMPRMLMVNLNFSLDEYGVSKSMSVALTPGQEISRMRLVPLGVFLS
mmetsp:Transcript_8570/g.18288  ORF Transcript_8570/g.18288 Transcript_8570/m.18288 type:complete len:206 (-) Transcript_8570:927-1544(-)